MEFNQHLDSLLTTFLDIVSEKNPEKHNESPESHGTQVSSQGAGAVVPAVDIIRTSVNGIDLIWEGIFPIVDS